MPITPNGAPVVNYTLFYWLLNQSRQDAESVDTPSNDTTFDLLTLQPGRTYNVAVGGRNVVGLGAESSPGRVVTMLGEIPPAPEGVRVSVEREVGGEGALISISWQVRPLFGDKEYKDSKCNHHERILKVMH